MSAIACSELIVEVEAAAKGGSPERRLQMLQQVTELFLAAAARLQPVHIDLFDHVLLRLVARSETRALTKLAWTLAGIKPALRETMRRLARHADDTVAAPVLARAGCLPDDDLAQIICDRGQPHLLAIAGRAALSEDITSLLLKRAGKDAARALVKNPGARFPDRTHAVLMSIAERDDVVAEAAALRPDLPDHLLTELLAKTSDTVRARVAAAAPACLRSRIKTAVEAVAVQQRARETAASSDYAGALAMVEALNRAGKLNDSAVNRFAVRRELTNVITSVAVLSGTDVRAIEPLMNDERCEGVIIACRAARLNWQTTVSVLNNRGAAKPSQAQLVMGKEMFETLYLSSAQYNIRFEQSISASAIPAPAGPAKEVV